MDLMKRQRGSARVGKRLEAEAAHPPSKAGVSRRWALDRLQVASPRRTAMAAAQVDLFILCFPHPSSWVSLDHLQAEQFVQHCSLHEA